MQFWLSGLPSGKPPATLVRSARLPRRIEHDHREMEQAPELAHFEGRTWTGTCPTCPTCHRDIPTTPGA
ncbi:hypothetical protein [Streptomyces sp. NPDC050388]|uniref:hypothetical protein n=1 Tax=Streptomyces sp. NPDC050388 TaxID=3155781 RepID=UPI0034197A48